MRTKKSKQRTNHILFFVQFSSALLFVIYKWMLPSPPSAFPLTPLELALLILFFGTTILSLYEASKYRSKKGKGQGDASDVLSKIISVCIFAAALVITIFAGNPAYKTHSDAKEFNEQNLFAAQTGIELGRQVEQNTIATSEAGTEIERIFADNSEAQSIASDALNQTVESVENSKTILSNVYPTIPVSYDSWTCNDTGCSYADTIHIWTISAASIALSRILNFLALSFITIVVSEDSLRKLFGAFTLVRK